MRVVVLGGGESGYGAAYLAKTKGYDVFLSDYGSVQADYKEELNAHQIHFEEGKHSLNLIFSADIIVKSPGISNTIPLLVEAKEKGIEIISEIEWAYRYINGGKIIGITGSNGKTTTTSLMYEVLKNYSSSVCLAGNIGISFSFQVASQSFDYYVLELSSFQLDDIVTFKPDIAILLNLSADHLDRYNWNMTEYVDSKFRIAMNQTNTDYFIGWKEGEHFLPQLDAIKSKERMFSSEGNQEVQAFFDQSAIYIKETATWQLDINNMSIKGKHNYMNVMAVGIASQLLDIPKAIVEKGLREFQSVEHRLESVRTLNNIQFINDSKATNVDAVYYALDTFVDPIVWIAGGIDKGNDYTQIKELVLEKVKVLICVGENITNFKTSFENEIPMMFTSNMEAAVALAYEQAESKDVVLLSPACSSFDLFNNYGHRGKVFKELVHKLK